MVKMKNNNSSQFEVKKEVKTLSNLASGDTKLTEKSLQLERSGSASVDNRLPANTNVKMKNKSLVNLTEEYKFEIIVGVDKGTGNIEKDLRLELESYLDKIKWVKKFLMRRI